MKFFIVLIIGAVLCTIVFFTTSQFGLSPEKNGSGTAIANIAQANVPDIKLAINEVVLAPGVTAEVSGLSIRFNSLVQDSRCGVDVQCIQAGAVTVSATLEYEGKKETRNLASDEAPYEFNGNKISIVAVSPEPRSTVTIAPVDYKVTFKVN